MKTSIKYFQALELMRYAEAETDPDEALSYLHQALDIAPEKSLREEIEEEIERIEAEAPEVPVSGVPYLVPRSFIGRK